MEVRSRTVCSIHDLMHDIAVSVMGNDCLNIVDRHIQKELLSVGPTRHLFSSYRFIGTLLDDYLKIHSPALQTQLCPTYSLGLAPHLLKYSHLRALKLCGSRSISFRTKVAWLQLLFYSSSSHLGSGNGLVSLSG